DHDFEQAHACLCMAGGTRAGVAPPGACGVWGVRGHCGQLPGVLWAAAADFTRLPPTSSTRRTFSAGRVVGRQMVKVVARRPPAALRARPSARKSTSAPPDTCSAPLTV